MLCPKSVIFKEYCAAKNAGEDEAAKTRGHVGRIIGVTFSTYGRFNCTRQACLLRAHRGNEADHLNRSPGKPHFHSNPTAITVKNRGNSKRHTISDSQMQHRVDYVRSDILDGRKAAGLLISGFMGARRRCGQDGSHCPTSTHPASTISLTEFR